MTTTTLEQDIANLETQLETARALREVTQGKATPMQNLAEELHTMLCHWNHTDGCGWYYEIRKEVTDWTGYAHKDYFAKAVALTRLNPNMKVEDLTNVVATIEEVKRVR